MDPATVREVFDRLHAASRRGPAADLKLRLHRLSQLRRLLSENARVLGDAIASDFGGRAYAETRLLEAVPTLNAIRYAQKQLARWMEPVRRPVDLSFQPARAYIRYEPLGVVGVISPWNYPLLLTFSPLVDALAAGNRVLLKPSELTPVFAELTSQLVAAYYQRDEVAVVTGGRDVAEQVSSLPFDHLIFTGSTEVGRKVMQAAAANLTPVTLELGGKSPAVVCRGFPIVRSARSVAFGKFLNAGQTCIAPDYVLVPEESAKAFATAVIDAVSRSYPTLATNDDYTAIISSAHRTRLQRAVEDAEARGAQILVHPDGAAAGANKFTPTVVLNAPHDSLLLTEEIFGPILPVIGYRTLEDALSFINSRTRPLALYCFSEDARATQTVLDGAISGGVTLNGVLMHIAQESLPFGGVGASGIGAYHGEHGFRRFSHARAVHQVGSINAMERLGPPWGRLAQLAGDVLVRRR